MPTQYFEWDPAIGIEPERERRMGAPNGFESSQLGCEIGPDLELQMCGTVCKERIGTCRPRGWKGFHHQIHDWNWLPFRVAAQDPMHRLVARLSEPVEQRRFEREASGRMRQWMGGKYAQEELERARERIRSNRRLREALKLVTNLRNGIG